MRDTHCVIDGVKYSIKRPGPRMDLKHLTKDGIVARLDFDAYFDWLNALIQKWGNEPGLLNPTHDRINGLYLKMPEGDVIVKITQLHPQSKQVYCLDCYDVPKEQDKSKKDNKECGLQVLTRVTEIPVRYAVVLDNTKGGTIPHDRKKIMTAAQVISTLIIGVRIYINLTKFCVYDEITHTYGGRIVDVEPISIFGCEDYLLNWEG